MSTPQANCTSPKRVLQLHRRRLGGLCAMFGAQKKVGKDGSKPGLGLSFQTPLANIHSGLWCNETWTLLQGHLSSSPSEQRFCFGFCLYRFHFEGWDHDVAHRGAEWSHRSTPLPSKGSPCTAILCLRLQLSTSTPQYPCNRCFLLLARAFRALADLSSMQAWARKAVTLTWSQREAKHRSSSRLNRRCALGA